MPESMREPPDRRISHFIELRACAQKATHSTSGPESRSDERLRERRTARTGLSHLPAVTRVIRAGVPAVGTSQRLQSGFAMGAVRGSTPSSATRIGLEGIIDDLVGTSSHPPAAAWQVCQFGPAGHPGEQHHARPGPITQTLRRWAWPAAGRQVHGSVNTPFGSSYHPVGSIRVPGVHQPPDL